MTTASRRPRLLTCLSLLRMHRMLAPGSSDAKTWVELGVLDSMLGPTCSLISCASLLAREPVSHMILPLRANRCGTLPQSRLAKQGSAHFNFA